MYITYPKKHLKNYTPKTQHKTVRLVFILISILSLNACDSNSPQTNSKKNSTSIAPVNISEDLSKIYQYSCKTCHENSSTGAPQTGDHVAWNKILKQGIANTVDKAMQGTGGMPPAGQCFECTPEQIETLILFMASKKQ